ncbi:MAG: DUF4124 domain-containing protein [Burkholderiales bacterium]|nr:DUF4124 domain-containing protein [Burkholderiales bacterium]
MAGGAWAQASIYTCVDAKGRRLTSDRPIIDCLDREQQELTATGTVKRVLKPSMTAEEAAADEERQRKANEERMRAAEEKKRARALLSRYPDRAAHDRERAQQLAQVDVVINSSHKRTEELEAERRKLLVEAEFFKDDKSKIPPALKRQLEQNEQAAAAQKRFIDNQSGEKQRINARFDDELVKLRVIWADVAKAAGSKAAAASAPAPR